MSLLCYHAMQNCDIVVYDALVNPDILRWVRHGVVLEYAGKRGGKPSPVQQDISLRLIELARAGKRVLRLKGGDPFMFGRGGEESQALAKAKIPFRIVPGITAGVGGLAYAGIPSTHRDTNHSVIFLTGHDATGKMPANVNWQAVATASPVIVMYMAVKNLGEIAQALMEGGRAPKDPVTIISNASLPHQQVQATTLDQAGAFVAKQQSADPCHCRRGPCLRLARNARLVHPGAPGECHWLRPSSLRPHLPAAARPCSPLACSALSGTGACASPRPRSAPTTSIPASMKPPAAGPASTSIPGP